MDRGFDSEAGKGRGEGGGLEGERHARGEQSSAGQGYSKGSRLQAIVSAAPFVSNLPFLDRHPPAFPSDSSFFVFLIRNFVTSSPLSLPRPLILHPSLFVPLTLSTENFIPLSPLPASFILITLDPAAISSWLLSMLIFPS